MIPTISDVRGIGPATARTLAEQGIQSVADLAAIHVRQLTAMPGFSDIRAAQVIDDAAQLLVEANKSVEQSVDEAATEQKPVLKVKQKKTKNNKTTQSNDKRKQEKTGKAKKSDKKVKVKNKDQKKAKKQSGKVKSNKSKQKKSEKKSQAKSTDKKKKKSKNS